METSLLTAEIVRMDQSSFYSCDSRTMPLQRCITIDNEDIHAPLARSKSLKSLSSDLASAIPLNDKFQKQSSFAQKLRFFSQKTAGSPVHESFKLDGLLCFQKDPIPTSLLKINADLIKHSVNMFKLILKFMGVDSLDSIPMLCMDERIDLVLKLYQNTLKHSSLCDELFAQILKQTHNNPNRSYLIKAWELMYLCASFMLPSKDFVAYILDYVHDVAAGLKMDLGPEVQSLALNTFNALKRSVEAGPRLTFPACEEIEAHLTCKKVKTVIFFVDDTSTDVMYDMTTTVFDSIQELASLINLSTFSSFSLFECRQIVRGSNSTKFFNEEFIRLDGKRYIGDLLAEFKSTKVRSKEEMLHFKLVFKGRLFQDSDIGVSDPIFLHLLYIQIQHEYILGYYPAGRKYSAELTALQILAEIGFIGNPDSCVQWTSLVERFLPRQIAMTRAKREWEHDIIAQYNMMKSFSKDDAKKKFVEILWKLPYGNSIFFCTRKTEDPIGFLPDDIILGVNKRGVHFFRSAPKEYLHSVKLKNIKQFGSSNTAIFFKMRISGALHFFQFDTKQGEEICITLQAYIKDVLHLKYSKSQNSGVESIKDDAAEDEPAKIDIFEKYVLELEESHKNVAELLEDLHARQKQESDVQGELDKIKVSLDSNKENLQELISKCDEVKKLCDEKELALQAALFDKGCMETKLANLSLQEESLKNTTLEIMPTFRDQNGGDTGYVKSVLVDFQIISKLQDDMMIHTNELNASKGTAKAMLKEKQLLEEKIVRLEKKINEEVSTMVKNFEDERLTLQLRISDLEKKLKSLSESLNVTECTISARDIALQSLSCNFQELEELREIKEDFGGKNEQISTILTRQGAQLAELEALYKGEQLFRKQYCNAIEDMKGKIRVFCCIGPLNRKEIVEKENIKLFREDEFTVTHLWKEDKLKKHCYDRVFDESASQNDVFEETKYLVQYAVDGYNVCIFAYGQISCGKKFSIYGTESDPGLVPRATRELFKIMEHCRTRFSFSLKVCMVELYQDSLVDLLLPQNGKRLKLNVKKNSKGMVCIENATVLKVSCIEEFTACIVSGVEQRHISGNIMDGESSRSHLILSIVIECTNLQSQTLTTGKLSFIDLASSERIKKTGSSGSHLKEAQSISKSLSALGDVISALCSEGQHVPYRNHKLTMLMSDSLGGNAKTLMFVNVSPAESSLDESYHSLMLASRVRSIVNNPSKNVASKEIASLKKLVEYWREQAGKQGDDEELDRKSVV